VANPRVDRVGSRCGRGIACSARYTPQPRVRGRGANFFFFCRQHRAILGIGDDGEQWTGGDDGGNRVSFAACLGDDDMTRLRSR
jgi:hypothetical protein